MNSWKRLRPIAIAVGVLLIIAMVEFLIMRQLKDATGRIVMDTLPGLSYGGKVNAEVAGNFVRTLLIITASNSEERETLLKEIAEASRGVGEALKAYEESIYEPEDRRLFDTLMGQRARYTEVRQNLFRLIEADKEEEALRLFRSELLPVYTEYTRSCDAVFDYNMNQAAARGRHIMGVCSTTQLLVVIIGIAVFIGGLLTPFLAIASLKESRV